MKGKRTQHYARMDIHDAHVSLQQLNWICYDRCGCALSVDACSGDLATLIKQREGVHFAEDQVLTWFVQLCLALKYCHSRRIIHRGTQ